MGGRAPGVRLSTFAEAAAGAELVVNASGGAVALGIIESAGTENLAGKVLLDIVQPAGRLDGFPPQLFVKVDDSLAETIQRAHPGRRVVKTPEHDEQRADGRPSAAGRGHDRLRLRRRRGRQGDGHRAAPRDGPRRRDRPAAGSRRPAARRCTSRAGSAPRRRSAATTSTSRSSGDRRCEARTCRLAIVNQRGNCRHERTDVRAVPRARGVPPQRPRVRRGRDRAARRAVGPRPPLPGRRGAEDGRARAVRASPRRRSTAAPARTATSPASAWRSRRSAGSTSRWASPSRPRSGSGINPILTYGTDEQKQTWLPDLVAGRRARRLRPHRARRRLRRGRHQAPRPSSSTASGWSTAPSSSSPTPAPTSPRWSR